MTCDSNLRRAFVNPPNLCRVGEGAGEGEGGYQLTSVRFSLIVFFSVTMGQVTNIQTCPWFGSKRRLVKCSGIGATILLFAFGVTPFRGKQTSPKNAGMYFEIGSPIFITCPP